MTKTQKLIDALPCDCAVYQSESGRYGVLRKSGGALTGKCRCSTEGFGGYNHEAVIKHCCTSTSRYNALISYYNDWELDEILY